jgi:hypothetical protein
MPMIGFWETSLLGVQKPFWMRFRLEEFSIPKETSLRETAHQE